MESTQLSQMDYHTAKALLEWQVEFGVTETISDTPINRFELTPVPKKVAAVAKVETGPAPVTVDVDAVSLAREVAAAAQNVDALRVSLDGFNAFELKRGARNLVLSDGHLGARVMVIGEAPDRDEDREGRPFVGDTGLLLDNMLKAIGLSRDDTVYLTNVIPWRLPRGHDVSADEIAMMLPFLERHVALAKPDFLVLMGNIACQAPLGKRGISRLRGNWVDAMGLPAIAMFHPAYLLNNVDKKREAWADLLSLKAKLGSAE